MSITERDLLETACVRHVFQRFADSAIGRLRICRHRSRHNGARPYKREAHHIQVRGPSSKLLVDAGSGG